MTEQEMLKRTKQFALRVLKLVSSLPRDPVGDAIARQLVRSGTSVGANYRSACRGRSRAEFRAKLGTVEEEADESAYWMELITEANLMPPSRVADLLDEAGQLTRIIAKSRLTLAKTTADRKSQIENRK